ncbi:type IV pilus modification PilV family protein [Intestinibacter bartlettii]|uniref:Type II secretion system GspH family protein n=1 Tax=Intestinibacter bartlettii TaxID=261299 RepID=A0ABS6E0M2_9FIRM|nr:type II secretion system protein [Intestinibacter bartlettii]MBU5337542.1 type II secretion system GspH family protein [Intestinibacter bartlettii]
MDILKRNGFTTLECMVSMVILSIIAYMISFSINNSFNLLNKNEEYLKMLALAQNYLNELKYDVKYGEESGEEEKTITVDGFEIKKKIKKQENYYNCYLIVLEVKSIDRSVKIESYVTKK